MSTHFSKLLSLVLRHQPEALGIELDFAGWTDVPTAQLVGQRHGKPVVLRVDATGLHAAGGVFYRSANGVWLIEHVPAAFLTVDS